MDIQLNARNLEITPRLQEYVEKKVSRLGRYLPGLAEVRVDLAVENTRSSDQRQVAQLTAWVGGTVLRAEERAGDLFAAIDVAVDKMRRQISRYKERRQDRWQRAGEEAAAPVPEEEEGGRLVRIKRFDMAPMTPEEAIEQMELLGHQFFVFLNVDEGEINVVYRRRDGNYGLIMPQV
ncbi:MAG TPA: ribosome-associated translation inhibitor RaiA [Thermoflexia bacterium]|jgi:putative sigma-54 modulation protein|nr:ribosome-associated translation inhibitor RaiA [Thermoflexia bacterium]